MNTYADIQVPAEIADEVRRFAAFVMADRQSATPTTPTTDGIPDYALWPDDDIVRFASAGTVTSRVYRRIMDATVEHDTVGKWVSIGELAEMTGQPASVVSTFRTHLNRYINAHLPEGTHAPFTRADGQDLRPARGRQVFYRVSKECAAQWTRVQPRIGAL